MTARRILSRWSWPSAPLAPLAPLYAAGLALKEKLLARGMLKTRALDWPVVSIGSVSVGGAGKTPVVIALATLLRARGWHVDVLSRGYGRKGQDIDRVRTEGENPAWWFGDEPTLIARRAGVPVWVGADRFAAGRLAESAESAQATEPAGAAESRASARALHLHALHILDDGFQHRQLARTVDIVLVTAQDIDDALLPAGNLREPLATLARADIIVLRQDEREQVEPRLAQWVRPGTPVWSIHRELRFSDGINAVLRPVGFCAIARPQNFWQMLDDAGCALAGQGAFPDHHHYVRADIAYLVQLAVDSGATGFVTTEKDAVKLSYELREGLQAIGPVNVALLDVSLSDEAAVLRDLEARLP
jgi:tetraacyldisaccharide 4'-kinase